MSGGGNSARSLGPVDRDSPVDAHRRCGPASRPFKAATTGSNPVRGTGVVAPARGLLVPEPVNFGESKLAFVVLNVVSDIDDQAFVVSAVFRAT